MRREFIPLVSDMGAGNQGVGLAAAERGFQAMDGRRRVIPGKSGEHLVEHHFKPVRGVGAFGEKLYGIRADRMNTLPVFLVEPDYLGKGCGENLRVERTGQDILPGLAGVGDFLYVGPPG